MAPTEIRKAVHEPKENFKTIKGMVGMICRCGWTTDICLNWGEAGDKMDAHIAEHAEL
jgi:hypothetical protein